MTAAVEETHESVAASLEVLDADSSDADNIQCAKRKKRKRKQTRQKSANDRTIQVCRSWYQRRRFIGHNGENINAVRTATGATINLDKLEDNGEANVTICGENARVAFRMIVALTHEPVFYVWDLEIWKMWEMQRQ